MTMVSGVSAGADGTVWCTDTDGNMYMRSGNSWQRNSRGKASEVAVGGRTNIWCRNDDGDIFKLKGTSSNDHWEKDPVASQVTSISVGTDGTVWVTNRKGEAVKLESGTWKASPSAKDAVEVAVGDADHVWYRNKAGDIFKLQNPGFNGPWSKDTVANHVRSISAGNDGAVWVANTDGQLVTKVDRDWKTNDKASGVMQVSAGKKSHVWCVNGQGEMFHAEANDWRTHWTPVAPPEGMAQPTTYTIKDGDQLLAVLRDKHAGISTAELTEKADRVARMNGWTGTLDTNYDGAATSLKAGDKIIIAA